MRVGGYNELYRKYMSNFNTTNPPLNAADVSSSPNECTKEFFFRRNALKRSYRVPIPTNCCVESTRTCPGWE